MTIHSLNIGYGSTIDTTSISLSGLELASGTKLRTQHSIAPESYNYVLSFWISTGTSPVIDARPLIQTWDGASQYGMFGNITNLGRISSSVYNGSEVSSFSSLSTINIYDAAWHHIVISDKVYPARQQIYVDGIKESIISSSTFSSNIPFKFQDIWALFNNAAPDGKVLQGCIDQVYFSFEDIDLDNPVELERFILDGSPQVLDPANAYLLLRGKSFINEGSAPVSIYNDNFYIGCGDARPNAWFNNFNSYTYGYTVTEWMNLEAGDSLTIVSPGKLSNNIVAQQYSSWGISALPNRTTSEIVSDTTVNLAGTYNNGLAVRVSASNYYSAAITSTGDGVLYVRDSGVATALAFITKGYSQDEEITCRLKIDANNYICVKWWRTNSVEPAFWDIENYNLTSNAVSIFTSGFIGISNEANNTSYLYDNIAVTVDAATAIQPNVSTSGAEVILPYVYWLRERMEKMSESGLNGLNMIRRLL